MHPHISRNVSQQEIVRFAIPPWTGTGIVFAVALSFGGGTRQGLWSDAVVQLVSLPLLASALWKIRRAPVSPLGRWALAILAGIALLPLLQLIPLPPSLWSLLPGRATFAAIYAETNTAPPWLGVSLDPAATWRSLLALLPPAAIFLSVVLLDRQSRNRLSLLLIGFGFLSVLVGLGQLAAGGDSALRFQDYTEEAVGFFANRNHFAALLYSIMPFTAAWAVGLAADRRREMIVGLALCLIVFASLLLGLGMARSRAGLALAMLGGFGSLALVRVGSRSAAGGRAHWAIYAAASIGVLLVLQFASVGILQRLQTDPVDSLRWRFTTTTFEAARDFLPFGSGIGTFEPIYQIYEGLDDLDEFFVNHAHNDYAELWLTAGVPALAVLAAFVGWLSVSSLRVWQTAMSSASKMTDRILPRAATVAVCLLMIHSFVDYPLRTTSLASLFAFTCALIAVPVRQRRNLD